MGYILEFRDEHELDNVMEKMHKAKKAVHEACEAMEEASPMNERGRYRGDYRNRYRDDWDDMNYRGGRYH